MATHQTWFGGVYQDPKNFFMQCPVNPDEFFAELSMWYFGMHGELRMSGPKPADGPEGLKQYDPEAFALMDGYYRGRLP